MCAISGAGKRKNLPLKTRRESFSFFCRSAAAVIHVGVKMEKNQRRLLDKKRTNCEIGDDFYNIRRFLTPAPLQVANNKPVKRHHGLEHTFCGLLLLLLLLLLFPLPFWWPISHEEKKGKKPLTLLSPPLPRGVLYLP